MGAKTILKKSEPGDKLESWAARGHHVKAIGSDLPRDPCFPEKGKPHTRCVCVFIVQCVCKTFLITLITSGKSNIPFKTLDLQMPREV